jgi:hypothetical protein
LLSRSPGCCPHHPDIILRVQDNLRTAHAGGDRDRIEQNRRFVNEYRIVLPGRECRDAAPDVAGKWLNLFQRGQFHFPVARKAGKRLHVQFGAAGNHREAHAVAVAPHH